MIRGSCAVQNNDCAIVQSAWLEVQCDDAVLRNEGASFQSSSAKLIMTGKHLQLPSRREGPGVGLCGAEGVGL